MNPFVITLILLDFLAGVWYLSHGQPNLGWLWISYGAGNIILLRIAGGNL